jgi:hypothetical protein
MNIQLMTFKVLSVVEAAIWLVPYGRDLCRCCRRTATGGCDRAAGGWQRSRRCGTSGGRSLVDERVWHFLTDCWQRLAGIPITLALAR